jgi:hypothetical protein
MQPKTLPSKSVDIPAFIEPEKQQKLTIFTNMPIMLDFLKMTPCHALMWIYTIK